MLQRKPTIYGPDGRPFVRVRDRRPPSPSRHVGMGGWVEWGLVDRRGRTRRGGEQHNLLLNTFLDRVAAQNLYSFSSFLRYFAVGTGSSEPDVSDAALDNEVARTSTLVESQAPNRVAPGQYEMVVTREFDFGEANGNLTEFGFSFGSSDAMLVRELFRDSGGNPITVTKTSDYKLRITYTFTVSLAPVDLTPASFDVSGIGTLNGQVRFHGAGNASSGSNSHIDLKVFSALACNQDVAARVSSAVPGAYDSSGPVLSVSNAGTPTVASYVPGSYSRSMSCLWDTTVGNIEIATIAASFSAGGSNNHYPGFFFQVDAADRFTKDNLHTLYIEDMWSITWSRA